MGAPFSSPYLRPAPSYTGGSVNRALMPAAATHEIVVDLRAGIRSIETKPVIIEPVAAPPIERPEVVRREPIRCFTCGIVIEHPKETTKFCSVKCRRSESSQVTAEIRKAASLAPLAEIPDGALSIRKVKAIVARVWRVPVESMSSVARKRDLSWPRQAAAELCYRLLKGLSTPQIGRAFGNRDHTTIMHAIAVTRKRIERDPAFSTKYYEAEAMCLAALAQQEAA